MGSWKRWRPTTEVPGRSSLAPPTGPAPIMNVPYVSDKIFNFNHP
jgi:hypothetical protein